MSPRYTFFLPLGLVLLLSSSVPAQKPELILQSGHSDYVLSVTFSPDDKLLASASSDNTIKLWDAATGLQLRSLEGHAGGVKAITFHPSGNVLASGSYDKTIKLWNVITGELLRTLKGHTNGVDAVVFSPDGKMLASCSTTGLQILSPTVTTISLWDVPTGRLLRSFVDHSTGINSIAFSPDGRMLASGSQDQTVKLWQVATGRVLRSLSGHTNEIMSVAFSPDGKMVASGSMDKTIRLWDVATGKPLRLFEGHTDGVNAIAFSPDGRMLASGSSYKELRIFEKSENIIRLWDVATGKQLGSLEGNTAPISSLAFNHAGNTLANGSYKTIKLWNVETRRLVRSLDRGISSLYSLLFSPDGKKLGVGRDYAGIEVWDLATGTMRGSTPGTNFSPDSKSVVENRFFGIGLWNLSGDYKGRYSDYFENGEKAVFSYSPDSRLIASSGAGKSKNIIKLWDVAAGKQVLALEGHTGAIYSIAFSPDGRLLASSSEDKTVRLWDIATGKLLHTLGTDGSYIVAFLDDKVLAYTSDDYKENIVKLWDAATGKSLLSFKSYGNLISYSAKSKMVALKSYYEETIQLWSLISGKQRGNLTGSTLAFSPDGGVIATGSGDTIKLWASSTLRLIRSLKGHASEFQTIVFSPQGKFLAGLSFDDKCTIWDPATGQELADLFIIGSKDWAVITPDGFFDGTPAAWRKIGWRFNNNTFNYAPVEAFYSEFYRPGLLAEVMSGKRPTAPQGKDITQKDRRQISVQIKTVEEMNAGTTVSSRDLKIEVLVEEAPAGADIANRLRQLPPSGAKDIRLFRNGTLVKFWRGDWGEQDGCKLQPQAVANDPRRTICIATVPIIAGENRLTAYAFNRDNVKSTDSEFVLTGAERLRRQSVTHILAIGINKYEKNPYFKNLKYAEKDAERFGQELAQSQKNLNQTEVFPPIYSEDATRVNILEALKSLARKVNPEDSVVIYFSGHGKATDDGRFYLIPHDVGYPTPQEILQHSISDLDLQEALITLDAGQIILILDACNSGQVLELKDESRTGPMNSQGLAQLAYDKGMYVLAAAQGYQAAGESSYLKSSLLTYALLRDGLTKKADMDPTDNRISAKEWLNYATQVVPLEQQELIEKAQKTGQIVTFVDEVKGDGDPLQVPRVFYRRDADNDPFIITALK